MRSAITPGNCKNYTILLRADTPCKNTKPSSSPSGRGLTLILKSFSVTGILLCCLCAARLSRSTSRLSSDRRGQSSSPCLPPWFLPWCSATLRDLRRRVCRHLLFIFAGPLHGHIFHPVLPRPPLPSPPTLPLWERSTFRDW